ncbi:LysR substrate-binding domain-containing protein [Lysobacter sp. 2RAB21]
MGHDGGDPEFRAVRGPADRHGGDAADGLRRLRRSGRVARIAATVWRSEPLRLIASADNPLGAKRRASIAELGRQTWLLREHGSGTRQVAQSLFAARGIAPARVIEIGSNEAIARAVAAGAGIALLPATVVADLILMQRVRAIALSDEDTLTRPLYRLELVNRPRSPALQAFLDEED